MSEDENSTFQPFPKIPRLYRPVTITEKLDGTNACLYISEDPEKPTLAGSRNRFLTKENDNYGFARWVKENEEDLKTLGPGYHYGEWYGQGIQRAYGLDQKRFSLFHMRWNTENTPSCVSTVPILYQGDFSDAAVLEAMSNLVDRGSVAVPGFMIPEGVCIYHEAAKAYFKVLLVNDSQPKGLI